MRNLQGAPSHNPCGSGFTRRRFLEILLAGGILYLFGPWLFRRWKSARFKTEIFIASASSYREDLGGIIQSGFKALGVSPEQIKGKRILLKPNLVETHIGAEHINTHPLVVNGAIEAFKALGAEAVSVAEGAGHCRDSRRLIIESGLGEVLKHDRTPFVDLNFDDVFAMKNRSGFSKLETLLFPATIKKVDWVVSMPKMKTHHLAGVTLSMKNLFGIMPGSYYGWPKNVLHLAGIHPSILDIYANLKPHFAIVDGIVGMEGDGPIMGTRRRAGVLVMGRNFPAVDATCSRIMSINPNKIGYLAAADGRVGTIRASSISQRGESIASVQTRFELCKEIQAHKGIRL